MKILLITNDYEVINLVNELEEVRDDRIIIYSSPQDSLELLSNILSNLPGLIIYDNDFMEENTIKIIQSVRKVNQNVPIIFIATELSIELGRNISQLKIHFSCVKPLSILEISESIKSIKKLITH